jgi:uncharacterized protein YbbC (DUF1343 family)
LHITNPISFEPYTTGLFIMQTHMELYPEQDLFAKPSRVKMFDRVVGTDRIRQDLKAGIPVQQQMRNWGTSLDTFNQMRMKYLIYK